MERAGRGDQSRSPRPVFMQFETSRRFASGHFKTARQNHLWVRIKVQKQPPPVMVTGALTNRKSYGSTEEQSFGTCRESTYTLLLSWVNTTSPKTA